MADNTKIEWADHTFNPWIGCTRVSPGCDNCYAAVSTPARTMRVEWGAKEERHLTSEANWKSPVRWNAAHEIFFGMYGHRQRVFCASLADVFDNHPDVEASRARLWDLIKATPKLDWLLLTKRIGNVKSMLPTDWGDGYLNVWLGISVVNQEEADRDIPKLLALPARARWLSMEPLLGPVDLHLHLTTVEERKRVAENRRRHPGKFDRLFVRGEKLSWVIVGGESGPKARPMHPDWARSLRDQCAAAGVPFLFKQWGNYAIVYDRDRDDPDWRRCGEVERQNPNGRWLNLRGGHGFHGDRVVYANRVGKNTAGRLLDGVQHDGYPKVTA